MHGDRGRLRWPRGSSPSPETSRCWTLGHPKMKREDVGAHSRHKGHQYLVPWPPGLQKTTWGPMADGKDPLHTGTRKQVGPCAPTGPKSLLAIWSRCTGHPGLDVQTVRVLTLHAPGQAAPPDSRATVSPASPHRSLPSVHSQTQQPLRLGDELPAQPTLRSQPHPTPHRPRFPGLGPPP